MLSQLLEKVKSGSYTLSVVGIGRVGLPLALAFANRGVKVFGVDVDQDYVDKLKRKEIPFIEEGIENYIKTDNFNPTTDSHAAIGQSDVIILTIGTPLTDHMKLDFSQLYAVLENLAKADLKNKILIMRSTASPDTLEGYIRPFLEKFTGLKAGEDFALAVCPERILEGKAFEELFGLPEIIGGINKESSEIAAAVFKTLNPEKPITITSPKSAELAKLFTNVYRYVNFALANEFALIAEEHGEDAHEIIKALNSGYKRGGLPKPGPAGGPCLSKDGYYLTSNIMFPDFIITAWRLNESIPKYVVGKMKSRLKEKGKHIHGSKIAVLGAAFKANIDDTRYSPAIAIVKALEGEGAEVRVHDPHIKNTLGLEEAIKDADGMILATNHKEFTEVHKTIKNLGTQKQDCIFIDCWGQIDPTEAKESGFDYIRFGKG